MHTVSSCFLTFSAIMIALVLASGCQQQSMVAKSETRLSPAQQVLPFAWPFEAPESMLARGGNSQGAQVTLTDGKSPLWSAIFEPGLSGKERDRRAILALSGDFRVSFQFVETAGFSANYLPTAPYFSWGTEHVHVLADEEDFISLQHTLVMFFESHEGAIEGPMVMKHWRQDWTYEDTELHVFLGNRTWQRLTLDAAQVAGQWTQAVYQVDDSPRYEVVGKWQHQPGYSAWQSQTSHRPLPRREFSVRDDYNLLEGEHRITLTPNGWLHEQFNRKVMKPSPLESTMSYVAQEVGMNRYERITEPSLIAAQDYWRKTEGYWQAVRETWREVYLNYDIFQLKPSFNGKKLFEYHFGHAAQFETSENYDQEMGKLMAEEIIHHFVKTGSSRLPAQKAY